MAWPKEGSQVGKRSGDHAIHGLTKGTEEVQLREDLEGLDGHPQVFEGLSCGREITSFSMSPEVRIKNTD